MKTNVSIKNRIENALKKDNSDVVLLCLIASCIASKRLKYLDNLFNYSISSNLRPKKIYELILQVYLFSGFPATIESLKIFNFKFNDFKVHNISSNRHNFMKSGKNICRKVYRNNFDKLMNNFSKLSPDLKIWMINEGYGKVMGRKGLSLKERELINVSVLSTNFYEHQLYSHIKGALNTGSDFNEIKSVIENTIVFKNKTYIKNSLKLLDKINKTP